MKFAVLDIEATGGKKGQEKIIDIAIYQFDGENITDQFASLVNPECEIETYIQKLTNITDKMVRRAPKFPELAKRIIEITKDCIIVGHGVHFDYRMLHQEFNSLGYKFVSQTLDTLDLSQKLLPNLPSYSLGKLCKSLGIPVSDRHRATGDTRATLELLKILLKKDSSKNILKQFAQIDPRSKSQINKLFHLQQNLPRKSGVYYFLDSESDIFYLQAAKNIDRAINQDFISKNKKGTQIQSRVNSINFELTGSFFIALLKQMEDSLNASSLIEKNAPFFYKYGLFLPENEIKKIKGNERSPFWIFPTKNKALKTKKLLEDAGWDINKSIDENKFILKNLKKEPLDKSNFILIDKGRSSDEKSFIEIEGNKIIGYGFFKFYNQLENKEIRHNILIPISEQEITPALARSLVHFHKFRHIISFRAGEEIKLPIENERKKSKNIR